MATILNIKYTPKKNSLSLRELAQDALEKRGSFETVVVSDPHLMLEIERENAIDAQCRLCVAYDKDGETVYSHGRSYDFEFSEIVAKDARTTPSKAAIAEELNAIRQWLAVYVKSMGLHAPHPTSILGEESTAIINGTGSAIAFMQARKKRDDEYRDNQRKTTRANEDYHEAERTRLHLEADRIPAPITEETDED